MNPLHKKINDYYYQKQIHPLEFNCPFEAFCQSTSPETITQAKMSMVGTKYGEYFPRIVVVSLDPPKNFTSKDEPELRTTQAVTEHDENWDFEKKRPNQHWAKTQIIVKDMLRIFGYPTNENVAVVEKPYGNFIIENVSRYFAHVNVAKCSMNKTDQSQADPCVHKICSFHYLEGELEILKPEIVISQGQGANHALARIFKVESVPALPFTKTIPFSDNQVLWMPTLHPSAWRVYSTFTDEHWDIYKTQIESWRGLYWSN